MRNIILFTFIFLSLKASSQDNDGFYMTLNGDTVLCKIEASHTRNGQINFSTLTKKVTVIENGEKKRFKSHDIRWFCIKNRRGEIYKFVSLVRDKTRFYNEVINGRLSLYYSYTNSPYDGSIARLPIMVKDDKIVYLNVVNPRQRIGNLISDCPDLYKEWQNGTNYTTEDKEGIVRDYNDCMNKH